MGEDGELFSTNAFTNENANFYIVTNESGNIVCTFYAWIGTDETGCDIMALDHSNIPYCDLFQMGIIKNIFDQIESSNIDKLYLRSNIYHLSGMSKITPKQEDLVNSEFSDNFSEITTQLIESQQQITYIDAPERPTAYDDYASYVKLHPELTLEWAIKHFNKLLQQTTKHGLNFICKSPLHYLIEEGIYTVEDIITSFNTHTFPFPYGFSFDFCADYKKGIKNFVTLAKREKIEFSDSWKAIQILNNCDLNASTSWELLQESAPSLQQIFGYIPGHINMAKLIEASLAGEDYSPEMDEYSI